VDEVGEIRELITGERERRRGLQVRSLPGGMEEPHAGNHISILRPFLYHS
jgi:hypothetical protein